MSKVDQTSINQQEHVTPSTDVTVILLKYPIHSASGAKIDQLTLRRAKRLDFKAAQRSGKDPIDIEDLLYERLTGVVQADLDKLDVADMDALEEAFLRQRGRSAMGRKDADAG